MVKIKTAVRFRTAVLRLEILAYRPLPSMNFTRSDTRQL